MKLLIVPRLFAGQQYFDSSGLFMTLVFSLPIVLNCLLILVRVCYVDICVCMCVRLTLQGSWLLTIFRLVVSVKRRERQSQLKEKKKK